MDAPASSTPHPPRLDTPAPLDLPELLRQLRHRADLSQRELAARAGLSRAAVGSIESGYAGNPRLRTVERLLAATGARLAVVDVDGAEPTPTIDNRRDLGNRRFPAHLDVRPYHPPPSRAARVGGPSGFSFLRNRRRRDLARLEAAGRLRELVTYDVRLLGSGDRDTLAALRAEAEHLQLGRREPTEQSLAGGSAPDALAYLRDPCLRHWVAQERIVFKPTMRGRVLAHLAARLHQHPDGGRTMFVVELGIRAEQRDGLAGMMLVAAMCDEVIRLGVGRVVAAVDDPRLVAELHRLGFRRTRHLRALALP